MLIKINDMKVKDIELKREISDKVYLYLNNDYGAEISHRDILRVSVNIYFNVSWAKKHIVICSIRSGTKLISRLTYMSENREKLIIDNLFKKEKDNE